MKRLVTAKSYLINSSNLLHCVKLIFATFIALLIRSRESILERCNLHYLYNVFV